MSIAKELYSIASEAEMRRLDAESDVAFNDIVKKARAQAEAGKFYLVVSSMLTETKSKLIAAGFQVDYDNGGQYGDSSYTIKWINAK